MTKVPSLSYERIVRALLRDGWVVVRSKGSHIRLEKRSGNDVLKITVPAHKPVKRSTLQRILRDAQIGVESFLELL